MHVLLVPLLLLLSQNNNAFISFVPVRDQIILHSRACKWRPAHYMSHSPNPTTFFRVESDSSRAQWRKEKGIIARKRTTLSFSRTCPEFLEMVENHLDWWSGIPSPFISVYSEMWRAKQEADRRMGDRHNDVVIWKIDTKRQCTRSNTVTSDALQGIVVSKSKTAR